MKLGSLTSVLCIVVGMVRNVETTVLPATNHQPLNIDLEWVLQGYTFGFQGFFVEYLGLSSSMRELLPQSRLVQSTFKNSFNDYPIKDPETFYKHELFPKESYNLHWLISKEQPSMPSNGYPQPVSRYFPSVTPDDCSQSSAHFEFDYFLQGNDLARPLVPSAKSAVDCCQACVDQPLCVAWAYDPTALGCNLKGNLPSYGLPLPGSVSGKMVNRSKRQMRAVMPRVLVFHGTMCVHNNQTRQQTKRDINTIYFGRFMLERAFFQGGLTIDEYSVAACAAMMDEIWVPTIWHKTVFERFMMENGHRAPMISIIPEAVDTTLFDPDLAKPVTQKNADIASQDKEAKGINGSVNGGSSSIDSNDDSIGIEIKQEKQCSFVNNTVTCNKADEHFEFLSIFKWEYRKGWDILLKSYWDAFSRSDQVKLRIRSYLPSMMLGESNITKLMETYASEQFGRPLSELAEVVWESGALPEKKSEAFTRADVRDLLGSVDCFVLPTRGEGWGLPIAEAMAMALPVIVTNHSGPAAYANDNNAYLISIHDELDSQSFARPNGQHLTDLMRQVVRDSSAEGNYISKEKGREARTTMQRISPDTVVLAILDRIRFHVKLRGGWEL